MVLKSPPLKAGIAQLVERNLAKVEVASSSLVSRSKDLIGKMGIKVGPGARNTVFPFCFKRLILSCGNAA